MLLKPAIVVAHLAGGMTLLGLLLWYFLSRSALTPVRVPRLPAALALAVVSVQILLGGWVSANYAALACPDLPLCLGQIVPPMDFGNAFHVLRELGRTGEGELLPQGALVAIQWSHRMFALVVVALVGWTAWTTWKVHRPIAALIAGLLLVQFSLGVANVAFNLPLALAAAHNAGAAALLAALVVLNFFAFRDDSSTSH
jgi:cytochrome c oxidase assembly protein subunit 15